MSSRTAANPLWNADLAISAMAYYVLMLGQTSVASIAAPAKPTLH